MTAYLRAMLIYWPVVLIPAVLVPGANVFAAKEEAVPIGVARVDVTPDGPIRLTGYASRKTESEGIAQHLWVKALAIGGDAGAGPAVLMTVDNCGVPGKMTAEVAGRLKAKGRCAERFVVCSTHTHSGPWLPGFARALLDEPLPAEHRLHLERTSGSFSTRWNRPRWRPWRRGSRDDWPCKGTVGSPSTAAPFDKTRAIVPGWA